MFDYTKAIFKKTEKDLETALRIFQLGTQILYIAYLIYLVLRQSSIWYLHLTLLIISVAFLAFDIITHKNLSQVKKEKVTFLKKKEHKHKLKKIRKLRSNIRKWKFYIAHLLKAFVLASAFYPMIASPYSIHPLSIICTTVMAFMWIIQIIFEVLRLILEDRGAMFIEALHADVEFITKPVNTVKNAFKRIIGKEVEEYPEPTDERVYLDKLVEKNRSSKTSAKSEARTEKSETISDWLETRISKLRYKSKSETDGKPHIVISDDENNSNEF